MHSKSARCYLFIVRGGQSQNQWGESLMGIVVSFILLVFSLFGLISTSQAKEIYFEIPAGTAEMLQDWNSADEPVMAEVGDVLTVKNMDSVSHQLHTDGRPCKHGDRMEPHGGTWSCELVHEYNSFEETNPTKDHDNYDLRFWVVVTAKK